LASEKSSPKSEFESQAKEQRLIAEIGRIASASPSLDSVFSAFADTAKKLIPFDRLAIATIEPSTGLLSDAHISGLQLDGQNFTGPYLLENSAVPPAVYKDFKTLALNAEQLINNSGSSVVIDTEKRLAAGLISTMFAPVVMQGSLVGVLVFRSKLENPYGERELDLADQVSAQIAGAISMNQQFELLERESATRQRLADEQTRIAEIGRIIGSTLSLKEVFLSLSEEINELINFDRFVIAEYTEDSQALSRLFANGIDIPDSPPGTDLPEHHQIIFSHNVEQQINLVLRGDDYKEFSSRSPSELLRFESGLRSLLAIPIIWRGLTIGSMFFRSIADDAFTPREMDLGTQVAQSLAGAIATSRQYSLTQEQSKEAQRLADVQARIAEIGRIVSSNLDFDDVLSQFAEHAKILVPHDRMVIARWSNGGQTLTDQYSDGVPIEGHYTGHVMQVPEDDIWIRLQKEQLPWVVNGDDYDEFKERNKLERIRYDSGLRAILIVPLLWRGGVSGSIALRSKDPQAFNEDEVEMAVAIAAQIAGAMDAADQFRKLEQESSERQRLADEQSRVAEIGRIVSSTLDLNAALSDFIDQVGSLLPFDRIVISVVNEELTEVIDVIVRGIATEKVTEGISLPFPESTILHESISNHEVFIAAGDDYDAYAKSVNMEQHPELSDLRSFVLVPLVWQGRPIGSINLRSKDPAAYGESEISIAKQVGAQIAGAIATSKQYSQLKEESETRQRLVEEQARIAEIGRIVSSTLDLDEVFKSFAEQARELIPFHRLVISLVDESKTTTTDAYVDGQPVTHNPRGNQHPLDGDIKESVVNSNVSLAANVSDLSDAIRSRVGEKNNFAAGLRSVLVVPLAWQGDVVGTLNFRSTSENAFGDREVRLAEQIGAQIAGAVATADQYRKLEQALSDSQIQEMAVEAADDAILVRNADATVIYVNSAFERQTGFTRDEILGTNFIYPENRDGSHESVDKLWELLRRGESWRSTVPSQHKDGTEYIVDATLNPIFNEKGEIDKFVGIRRDITARIKAEEANKTQAAALEAAGDAVFILNTDTSLAWVNEAFVRDTGYSREEAIGQPSPFLRSEKNDESLFEGLWEQVRTGQTWVGRVWTKRKDGSEYLCEASLIPVFDDNGKIARYVGTRRDITQLLQAELDRDARRDLDAQNQQLLELNKQREEFFSTVSHELRTPLTSVMAFADILSRDRDGTLSNLQKEHLDVIKRNGRNLNELVEDMLDFSRMSTDQLKLNKSEFEIHSLLDSVVESLGPTAGLRDQTLVIEPNTEPVWIDADHSRIVQVISNLITNSCKYSPPSTRISVKVSSELGHVSITVSDKGIGIPSNDLENIFSPFFRSDQIAVREEIGTGLGLAISKTLIDLHKGTINAVSELNAGTQITVTLPGASVNPTVNARN
jgi:PAS domain S-box-containing protein